MTMILFLIGVSHWTLQVWASNSPLADNVTTFNHDPILDYRPEFARSLPVQILLTGITLTLVAVLFIHLIFTGQYHWPLAPVNYVLQISAVTTLLISLIATLHVILSSTMEESLRWPYMLSYVAVIVPPLDIGEPIYWSVAERATWLIMNATTTALIQITHIQFLTLLYPSRLEGRLIFSLLGPLAITASVVQLLPIQSSTTSVSTLASAIRNVCNATLSLLFTSSLFIWGFLVNRRQAWRTDGGTAAFGCAALVLALISTALNFLYVPREVEYVWLPGLMWAVVLWQSFLGWWWWVGAGSGGHLHELENNERRRKRSRKDEGHRDRAKMVWRGVTNVFVQRYPQATETPRPASPTSEEEEEEETLDDNVAESLSPPRSPDPSSPNALDPNFSGSSTTLQSSTTSGTLPRFLPGVIHQWYAHLRHAHNQAALRQTAERQARIRELERERAVPSDVIHHGWGLGSFALRSSRGRSDAIEMDNLGGRRDDDNDNDKNMKKPSIWWRGPLGRWRFRDSTVY